MLINRFTRAVEVNPFAWYAATSVLFLSFLLIKYQQDLEIRYTTWVTIVCGCILTGLAISSGATNQFPDEYNPEFLRFRLYVLVMWIAIQIVLIAAGIITKVLIPCAFIHSVPYVRCVEALFVAQALGLFCLSVFAPSSSKHAMLSGCYRSNQLRVVISLIVSSGTWLCTGLNKEARFGPPKLKAELLWAGAVEKGMEEIWKRAPNLRQQLMHEYGASGTQLFSYSGTVTFGLSVFLFTCP
jgi:hypothetical protein